MGDSPRVLIVDDDPGQVTFAAALELAGVSALHVTPGELTMRQLRTASVIVIDEYLSDWPERDAADLGPGLDVRDGVALAAVIRAHLDRRGDPGQLPAPSSCAILLRTGELARLAAGVPAALRSPVVAARHDLEWVASKPMVPEAIVDLARAAADLPTTWNPREPKPQLEWLQLPETDWLEDAVAQIEQCRPPWSALAASSAGRLWLGWFLQRILPFSTFLVDDLHAAASLGLQIDGFLELLEGRSPLAQQIQECVYAGALATFGGRRWWRAGISMLRRDLAAEAGSTSAADVGHAVTTRALQQLRLLDLHRPVFEIDSDYQVNPHPIEMRDAVRLQPDGWPSFADSAWLAIENIEENPTLASLIIIDDREEASESVGRL